MATDQSRTPSPEQPGTETMMARQYGRDVQHVVFGLHGTVNNPGHVRPLTEKVASALSNTPNSGTTVDTSFDWSKRAGFFNQPGGREKEGDKFAQHVDNVLTEMKKNGQLDPNKPVQITVVGFSHGGNVAIAATPELADVMRKHGLNDNGSLHLVTVSTPAYNNGGNEDPAYARREAANRGLDVHHTHFSPKNDGVIRLALGNAYYHGPGHPNKEHRDGHVYNYPLQGKGFLNPIGSHGDAQDDAATVRNINNQADKVANIVAARTLDIHNRNGRPRPGGHLVEGDDGVELASAQPKTAEKTDQYRETSVVSAINAVRTPAAQEASVVAPISIQAQPNVPANPHPSQELLASPGVTDRIMPVQVAQADAVKTERPMLISEPGHPRNGDYQQAYAKLGEAGIAFPDDKARSNAAAFLVQQSDKHDVKTFEHMLSNGRGGLIVIDGGLQDPAHKRFAVSVAEISAQPVEISSQKLQQEAARPSLQPDAATVAQDQTRPSQGHRAMA
jgi:hypothetical protein